MHSFMHTRARHDYPWPYFEYVMAAELVNSSSTCSATGYMSERSEIDQMPWSQMDPNNGANTQNSSPAPHSYWISRYRSRLTWARTCGQVRVSARASERTDTRVFAIHNNVRTQNFEAVSARLVLLECRQRIQRRTIMVAATCRHGSHHESWPSVLVFGTASVDGYCHM